MSEWQPIETAPTDIGPCLVIEDCAITTRWHFAFCSDGAWIDLSDQQQLDTPTHWMPLPAPPQEPTR